MSNDCLMGSNMDAVSKTVNLLKIGLRAVKIRQGNIAEFYALIPTFDGEWVRELSKRIRDPWEGSYIPLIISSSGFAMILVGRGFEEKWKPLTDRLSEALGMPVVARGD